MIVIGASEVASMIPPPRAAAPANLWSAGWTRVHGAVVSSSGRRTGASSPHFVPWRADQSSSTMLHKLHLRLTKVSALAILKSTRRKDEMSAGGTFRQIWEHSKCWRSWFWFRSSLRALAAAMLYGRGARGSDRRAIVFMRLTPPPRWRPIGPRGRRDRKARVAQRNAGRCRNNHVRLG